MPQTKFATGNVSRFFEEASPPLGWFNERSNDTFYELKAQKGRDPEASAVAFTRDPDIARAWVKAGVLPEQRTPDYAPELTFEHLFAA